MLITRPFTNEEVAARLELGCMDPGMIAEACKRLRGLPASGCPTAPPRRPRALPADGDGMYWRRNDDGSITVSNYPFAFASSAAPVPLPTICPEMIPEKESQ